MKGAQVEIRGYILKLGYQFIQCSMEEASVGRYFQFAVLLLACAGAFGFTLDIVHVNDTHSNLEPVGLRLDCPGDSVSYTVSAGSVAAIAREVEKIRGEGGNTVFLHAGDLVQGTLFYTVYGGRADAAVYNDIMPDVMVTGNHEFDRGSEGLSFLLDLVEFPVICANLDVSGDSLLAGLLPPYVILEKGGEQIGVVGVVTEELASVSSPSAETVVLPAAQSVQTVIDEFSASGINKIIVLSHMGYENDLELASSLRGADVIVGGHSHTLLGDFTPLGLESAGDYPTVVQGADGEAVLVVQAWCYTRVLGRLQVEFDENGEITDYAGMPRILAGEELFGGEDAIPACFIEDASVDVTPGDEFVQGLVNTYGEVIADYENEPAATAAVDLPNQRVPGGNLPQGSMIAPLVCDVMLWKANQLGSGADMALQNAGGVRIDIPAGEITVGTVYRLLPFANTLAVLDVTGAELRQTLEGALTAIFDQGMSDGAFPYVAGVEYHAELNGVSGQRITSLVRVMSDGTKVELHPDSTYRVVTNAFVAKGGDGYGILAGVPFTDTGFTDSEVFLEYIRQLETVEPAPQRVFLTE